MQKANCINCKKKKKKLNIKKDKKNWPGFIYLQIWGNRFAHNITLVTFSDNAKCC